MNRRELVLLSATAVAAHKGFAQTSQSAGDPTARAASKALLKLTSSKANIKIPKTDAKTSKYVKTLTTALSLTPDQQGQAASIFAAAQSTRTTLRTNAKTAMQSLGSAVKATDAVAIGQLAVTIGTLRAQMVSAGANAHAAFYRLLTLNQQALLNRS
jgi:hypothetical protein